jgi:hypothetical protein
MYICKTKHSCKDTTISLSACLSLFPLQPPLLLYVICVCKRADCTLGEETCQFGSQVWVNWCWIGSSAKHLLWWVWEREREQKRKRETIKKNCACNLHINLCRHICAHVIYVRTIMYMYTHAYSRGRVLQQTEGCSWRKPSTISPRSHQPLQWNPARYVLFCLQMRKTRIHTHYVIPLYAMSISLAAALTGVPLLQEYMHASMH